MASISPRLRRSAERLISHAADHGPPSYEPGYAARNKYKKTRKVGDSARHRWPYHIFYLAQYRRKASIRRYCRIEAPRAESTSRFMVLQAIIFLVPLRKQGHDHKPGRIKTSPSVTSTRVQAKQPSNESVNRSLNA